MGSGGVGSKGRRVSLGAECRVGIILIYFPSRMWCDVI